MTEINKLTLVNYCHPDCEPMLNIMRLPREEAFRLAAEMAAKHPETMAFYRFADFENYYPNRSAQDRFLYARFIEKGGEPEEEHPLSFVIEGSDYLAGWFDYGTETRLALSAVDPRHISFTIGDSGAMVERDQQFDVLTLGELKTLLEAFDGTFGEFLTSTGRGYIEAQLWSDGYLSAARQTVKRGQRS